MKQRSNEARKQGGKEARKQGSNGSKGSKEAMEARKQGSKKLMKQGSNEARKQWSNEAIISLQKWFLMQLRVKGQFLRIPCRWFDLKVSLQNQKFEMLNSVHARRLFLFKY